MCSKSWRKGWRGALVCSALWLLTGAAAAQEDFLRQGEQDSSRAVEVLIPDQGLLSGGAPAAPEEASASQVEVLIPDRGLLSSDAPAVPEAAPAAPVAEVAKPAPAPAPVAPVAEAAKPTPAPAAPKKEDEGWATVGTDGAREVQLDRGGVIDSDAGTKVAWVRINMLSNGGQDYAAIKAMNRFD